MTTIAIPLVAYTLFVLYRNIMAGLRGVPAEVLESARGMGLTRRQTFLQVELPLATPAIMAGLRVATVATISIATIGAFVLHYGLGAPIFDALGLADIFRTELVTAGALAILLALAADLLLSLLQRALTPWSRTSMIVVASLFIDALRFIPDNAHLLLDKAIETAKLAFAALGIALVVAVPLGLWLGHRHRGLTLALGVSSVGRALPSIVLIGLFIAWLGVGFWNVTMALVVIGIPPLLTNAYLAVDGVERDVVEAARGMGLTERQILTGVELPLGLPLLLAGFRIAAVFVIATATIAGIAGVQAGGLGQIMVNPVFYGDSGVLAAAFVVAAMSLLTAFVLGLAQRAASRRMAPRA